MTDHLIVLSLGPVQDFIRAARRTRDLWFGSLMLSEVSKAAAMAVHRAGGILIFPAPLDPERELSPIDLAGLDADPELISRHLSAANIILARLPSGTGGDPAFPDHVAKCALKAAHDLWLTYARSAWKAGEALLDKEIWDGQLDDVLEFYAAWMDMDGKTPYKDSRRQLMRVLAGRKALRNFNQWRGQQGRPKSSLDGARESVLIPREELEAGLKQDIDLNSRLRLTGNEQLDAIGFTKRAASRAPFASVTRVALDPWLRGIAHVQDAAQALAVIADLCQKEADARAEGTSFYAAGSGAFYKDSNFRYDGRVLFAEQLASLRRELEHPRQLNMTQRVLDQKSRLGDELGAIADHLCAIKAALRAAGKRADPVPYYAIIKADGDRMGSTLDELTSADAHRCFSQALAGYAALAQTIVSAHFGCLVYSGGDDVLALLPLDTCLACAKSLHDAFGDSLRVALPASAPVPTLSVGVAIGHVHESLEDMLQFAAEAEHAAKLPDRNGLAVHLRARGGDVIAVREQWSGSSGDRNLAERLQEWAACHINGLIPDGAAFDLHELVRRDYKAWQNGAHLSAALAKDIGRMFGRKASGSGEAGLLCVAGLLDVELDVGNTNIDAGSVLKRAARIANELILTRRIAEAMAAAKPPAPSAGGAAGITP